MPVRMKLSSVYSTLPAAERKVADFILSNPKQASHMVINEIAHHAGVSVPSVTRLARKLGYSGFMDFRISLASSASSSRAEIPLPISPSDPDDVIIHKLIAGHMSAIDSTQRVLDTDCLAALADRILAGRRVVWFGVGDCVSLARIFSDQLCRLDIDSVVIESRAVMNQYASHLGSDDIAICLTRTGKTHKTLDCLRIAKERGALTVLITNLINSAGEQYADHFICASRQDELYRICGYETFTSICALLETLVTLLSKKKGFESKAHYIETMTSQR